jgi:hypothetical protein
MFILWSIRSTRDLHQQFSGPSLLRERHLFNSDFVKIKYHFRFKDILHIEKFHIFSNVIFQRTTFMLRAHIFASSCRFSCSTSVMIFRNFMCFDEFRLENNLASFIHYPSDTVVYFCGGKVDQSKKQIFTIWLFIDIF